jgi:hypothetical protein
MAGGGVRKPTLPRVSLGLGNILAQSETVVRAFGAERGFILMLVAILSGASVSLGVALLIVRSVGRALG